MLRVAFLLAAAAAHAQQLPITGLGHVGFLTSDLDKARQFYTGVLGYEQAFDLKDDTGRIRLVFFKVNDEQFLEIFPGLKPGQNERMNHVAFVTPDIEKLHAMLTDRGLQPSKINKGQDGNLNCSIKDPGGLRLEFTQYLPGSLQSDLRGKLLGDRRISDHLWHAGILARDLDAAMAFYRDKLGFEETWRGGPAGTEARWFALRMPGPRGDYVELMLYSQPPTRDELGSMQHICLEVPDVPAAYKALAARGWPDATSSQPRIGRNGRRQLNLFDPDGSRTELMERQLATAPK